RGRAADRRTIGHPLREGHHFRLDLPALDAAPHIPGGAPTFLPFLPDKDPSVAPDDLGHNFEVFLRGSYVTADSHYRLSYEGSHAAGVRGHDQLLDVARALERAGIRLEIERTAIAIRRVGVNYSRDRR